MTQKKLYKKVCTLVALISILFNTVTASPKPGSGSDNGKLLQLISQ
jgi:hypothetical protein